mmetsp:Transcript_100834/g.285832  ORF Transcript_100834/g.285832 Transcript_100834/m.285832 type:complete len:201 (-) Transcript_100834:201-803(-)
MRSETLSSRALGCLLGSSCDPHWSRKSRIRAKARQVSACGMSQSAPWWQPRMTSCSSWQPCGNLASRGACTAMSGSGSWGYSTTTRPKLRTEETSMAWFAFVTPATSTNLDIQMKLPGTGSKSSRLSLTCFASKLDSSWAKYKPPIPPRLSPTKFTVTASPASTQDWTHPRTTSHCSLRPAAKRSPRRPCETPQPGKQSL